MKHTPPLQPETYYHIYNRGINGETIFKHEENYSYFLKKYDRYISPIADTYAYCLLNNHFHFLIKAKAESEILNPLNPNRGHNPVRVGKTLNATKRISQQFSNLFNGYTQAFNKQHDRTGKLFELPFRRIAVESDPYFSMLIYYIHANPQKHGLISDFREWPHSSYHSHLSDRPTKLNRQEVIQWFGERKEFLEFHASFQDVRLISPIILD